MASDSVFEVDRLTKIFDVDHVANCGLSFTISASKMYCLLGPNGAGKTTLLRQMLGLVAPTSGSVRLLGRDVEDDPGYPSTVCAYLPQDPVPVRELRVRELVEVAARLRGSERQRAQREASAEIERWGLTHLADAACGRLSGGERRLLGIASTLVGNRPVIILDEPTNDLDPDHRAQLWSRLDELRADGRTVLVITHNLHEVSALSASVLIMNSGRLALVRNEAQIDAHRRVRVDVNGDPHRTQVDELMPTSQLKPFLADLAKNPCVDLGSLEVTGPSLEDIYRSALAGYNEVSEESTR